MTKKRELQPGDRDSFRVLSDFAFRNPFDKKSLQLAYRVAGGKYPVGEPLSNKVFERVKQQLEKVTVKGEISWQQFSGEDQDLVRVAILHDSYDRCHKKFDDLISKQIKENDSTYPVSFANKTLLLLRQRGFSVEDSLRYFSFYYQLRRAWYFINHGLTGQSDSMDTLRSHLWRSVFTSFPRWYEKFLWNRMEDFSTFLIGETGTGKGTAAAAIGRSGFIPFDEKKNCFVESFTDNFIEINLSQFPESLIESELFGHRKGAFTGAVDNHKGIFALCSPHGSIFLDEIGDVSIPIQIKLLKVLEERSFSSVGGHDKLHFKGRIVTATNKSLAELQQQKTFREDFYYRLCSNVIPVPTLRQQISEDPSTLEALLTHTILRITGEPVPELLQTMLHTLEKEVGLEYSWPGNVRELEQAVRSILLTLRYDRKTSTVSLDHTGDLQRAIEKESINAKELISAYCTILYRKHGTFEKVANITHLDPRTVKKHLQMQQKNTK
ncbi:MAG: sigma-54-dependent Fis family transcriptional regulator [Desulfobacterales bacterium]|nr:sigma 54-interacting transcriptional regulator [Deltaproteobacteria bacterium]NNK93764.1 sigma-54-dependent Fis family transcriptional regulator [Desulfobacterales bacterium]